MLLGQSTAVAARFISHLLLLLELLPPIHEKKKKKQKVTCSSSSFAFCQHNFRIFSLSPSVNISKMRETDSGCCNCFSYFLTTVDGFFLVHLMLRADIAEKEVSKIGQLIASLFFGRSRFITPHAPLSRIFYVCLCKKQVCLPSYFFAFILMISREENNSCGFFCRSEASVNGEGNLWSGSLEGKDMGKVDTCVFIPFQFVQIPPRLRCIINGDWEHTSVWRNKKDIRRILYFRIRAKTE